MQIVNFSELSKEKLDIMAKTHFDFFSHHNSTLTLEKIKNNFKNVYTNNNGLPCGIAIMDNDNVIGFCNLRLNALNNYNYEYPFICGLYILEEYRKKGYGTKLINYAKEKLKTLGYSKVFLWTEEIPTYYEKLGFNYVQDVLKNDKTGYGKLYSIDI